MTEEELDLYELAFLLRMPVYKIMAEMPFDELLKWKEYLAHRPIGWREDRRTALLMSAQGSKFDADSTFPSLKALRNGAPAAVPTAFFRKLNSATGGDKLEVLKEF